jgi:hypothetical protein
MGYADKWTQHSICVGDGTHFTVYVDEEQVHMKNIREFKEKIMNSKKYRNKKKEKLSYLIDYYKSFREDLCFYLDYSNKRLDVEIARIKRYKLIRWMKDNEDLPGKAMRLISDIKDSRCRQDRKELMIRIIEAKSLGRRFMNETYYLEERDIDIWKSASTWELRRLVKSNEEQQYEREEALLSDL